MPPAASPEPSGAPLSDAGHCRLLRPLREGARHDVSRWERRGHVPPGVSVGSRHLRAPTARPSVSTNDGSSHGRSGGCHHEPDRKRCQPVNCAERRPSGRHCPDTIAPRFREDDRRPDVAADRRGRRVDLRDCPGSRGRTPGRRWSGRRHSQLRRQRFTGCIVTSSLDHKSAASTPSPRAVANISSMLSTVSGIPSRR